ncbi:hypothetical protein [uncultured Friedmanniella sp.]|uniref:hypothetical protein n=1 Tax=uncultured Friedmanniella sp. TaxID=335381 RepID=UPI0035CCA979
MRVLRVLLALLVVAAPVVLTLLPASPAAAAEPEALVRIRLDSLTPALPTRDSTITVTGSVTNVTKDRLYRLQAIFWRNQAPITTAEGIEQALDSDSNVPLGARQQQVYTDLYAPDDPYLEAGASAAFTLRVKVADLQLSPSDGIYLMGVHVLQNGVPVAVGRARTFVPVLEEPPASRLQMTSLVVLSSRPSLMRRGVLVDDHLAAEVEAGGRLDDLLSAADSPGTSFAVDPALIEELDTMKDGYTVQKGDGASTTGRGRSSAAAWLARFASVQATRDGFRLLYGSPDVAALVHARQTDVLTDAVEAGRRVSSTASLPLLVLPGNGYADAGTVQAAERLHPAAIVLSDASVAEDNPLLAAPDGTTGEAAPIVRYSSATSGGGGPGPDPRTTPVQLRQRALADSWVQASATSSSTQGRVRLITSPKQVQGDDPGVQAPWVTPSTLGALLDGTPAAWDATFDYPDAALAAELTAGQLRSLRTFAHSSTTYAELLAHPGDARESGQAAVAAAASTSWRGDDRQRRLLLVPQQSALDAVLVGGLEIRSQRKVSTIAQQGVRFPITVKNLLPVDPDDDDVNVVNLRLVFVSDNPQRLTIKPIAFDPLSAGQSATENALVTARANGTVPVRAQLETMSGTPVGRPLTIDVRVTQNGTTGWAIAGAAMVVFLGGTALRIRRVGRARTATAEAQAEGQAGPPSALTSAPPTDADALERGSTAETRPEDRGNVDA